MRLALLPAALFFLTAAQATDLTLGEAVKGPEGVWDYASIDSAGNRLLVAMTWPAAR